ncbi:hypothetical protein QQ045_019188 [Rhodiola kirilowii]
MSKAYDRVEWSFLEGVLLQLGFDASWVSIVMNYVKSVRNCVRVNGVMSDIFEPSRGLHQGDPLSPYLFIICTEWLSHELHLLHQNQRMTGLRICRRYPYISHLFFADDALLFFKANNYTVECIKSLLHRYEQVSGQMVNYEKSALVLSPNASDQVKIVFQTFLSVQIVVSHTKYLGLPLLLDRKWSSNFSSLLDRVWNKTNGWGADRLSCGGKEVLIKSVLQAIPQSFMHCFLLPEGILSKMQNIINAFWWRNSQTAKPILWVKSDLLFECKEGGLG